MTDFYERLSSVLEYCSKDFEKEAASMAEVYASFSALAKADTALLDGICDKKSSSMIKLLAALASRKITDRFKFGKTHAEEELFEFLSGYYYDIVNETILILPIDRQNRILAAEVVMEGTVNFSRIITRKLLEIMQKHKASGAILVHNHPGGKAEPSEEDVETTRIVSELFSSANKRLVCHYIVAGTDIYRLDPKALSELD